MTDQTIALPGVETAGGLRNESRKQNVERKGMEQG
jgi:hypothetical protein